MDYSAEFCEKCLHYEGCPIWSAHWLYNYDVLKPGNEAAKDILNILIPVSDEGENKRCLMFYPTPSKQRIECHRGLNPMPDQSVYVQPWPMPEKRDA